METKRLRVGAKADFKFDFAPLTNGQDGANTDWLESGETIASVDDVTMESGITLDSSGATDANTSVTAWLSGATAVGKYRLSCEITTSGGRVEPRSMMIHVIDNHD